MRQTTCKRCNKPFEYQPKKVYCSPCRNEQNRDSALRRHHKRYEPKTTALKVCLICNSEFTPTNPATIYCSDPCKRTGHNIKSREAYYRMQGMLREEKPIITPQPKRVSRPHKVDLDAEQRRIDREIDARFNSPCEYTHYHRKHPDFMKIAEQYMRRRAEA